MLEIPTIRALQGGFVPPVDRLSPQLARMSTGRNWRREAWPLNPSPDAGASFEPVATTSA